MLADRLWFFASARRWGTTTGVANLFADTSVSDFVYTPDSVRPIEPEETNKGIGGRLTYQATSKDKLTFSWDKQRNFQDQLTGQLETGTIKNEGNPGYCQRHEVIQGAWSRPQSNSAALRRRRDGEQVQLRRLRRGPVPVGLRRLRRRDPGQRVDQRHRPRVHLQRRRQPHDEPVAPVERALQRLPHQRPAQHQDRRVLDVRPRRRAPHLHDARDPRR